jgi:uncharacterized membrane protein (Fun14 family)
MFPNMYYQIINSSYNNFSYLLTTREGITFTICVAFVIGFAIGVGYAMKKFLDIKKQLGE